MSYSDFKGTVTEYKNLHHWVGVHFGKPLKCEDCDTTTAKRYDWACIDGQYDKERSNWKRLCRSCHQKFDSHLFIGKRFAGKSHKPESRSKTSESLRSYWAKHPEQMKEMVVRRVATRKRNKELKNVSI